jgi:hypothetical protein
MRRLGFWRRWRGSGGRCCWLGFWLNDWRDHFGFRLDRRLLCRFLNWGRRNFRFRRSRLRLGDRRLGRFDRRSS